MRVWLYMALGLAMLALSTSRLILDQRVDIEERARCEAMLRADHVNDPLVLTQLLPHCIERGMIATMEARREGAAPQPADEVLAAAARRRAQSALINLALTLAGIGAFALARRCAKARRIVGRHPR